MKLAVLTADSSPQEWNIKKNMEDGNMGKYVGRERESKQSGVYK